MQIGVVYPQNELGGDPTAVGQIGRCVEELGFDHLLAYDHVLGAVRDGRTPELAGPYDENDPFHDPFVMFAYLAGITERLRFATGILILPQRQTALVARQAADVDLLSGGRLRLGVGVGWNYVEYGALGQDFVTRGAREEEQIGLLRQLFSEPVVDFSGRFDRVDRAALIPRPSAPVPIWLGGSSNAAYDRAARIADGFIFSSGDIEPAISTLQQIHTQLAKHGRSKEDFGADLVVSLGEGPGVPGGPGGLGGPGGAGGPGGLAQLVEMWSNAGGTHVTLATMRHGFTSIEQHLDHIASAAALLDLT